MTKRWIFGNHTVKNGIKRCNIVQYAIAQYCMYIGNVVFAGLRLTGGSVTWCCGQRLEAGDTKRMSFLYLITELKVKMFYFLFAKRCCAASAMRSRRC